MKKLVVVSALAVGLSMSAIAAQWSGIITDEKCSHNKAMASDADCAAKCIKGGSPAVLLTDDGTVYKITDQDKVVSHAGQHVTVTGKMEKGSIKVDKVKSST